MIILCWFNKCSEKEDYLTKVVYVYTVIQWYDSPRDETKHIIISPPWPRKWLKRCGKQGKVTMFARSFGAGKLPQAPSVKAPET